MFLRQQLLAAVAILMSGHVAIADGSEDISNPNETYALASTTYAPAGPTDTYVYKSTGDRNSNVTTKNTFGKFVIGPGSDDGKATYWWKGKGPASDPNNQHQDKLKFLGRATVNDSRPDTPGSVDGWLYEATDTAGDKWWLVFGEDKLNGLPYYPVYYSFDDPDEGHFKRWLTNSGTSRL